MRQLSPDEERRAIDLHARALVVDTHCDSLDCVLRGERHLGERSTQGQTDVPRLLDGGVTAQVFATGLDPLGHRPARPLQQLLHYVDALHRDIERYPEQMLLAATAADLQRAKREHKLAALLSVEDAAQLEGDLRCLLPLRRLGVRAIGLVWGPPNEVGIGVTGVPFVNRGLTGFGRELVREMNNLRLLLDVAHINEPGFWDVVECTSAPIFNSHANAAGLVPHPRNMTDDQLRAIADSGGLISVVFCFLRSDAAQPSVDDLVDHIDHIAGVVGAKHIGIGSDFDALPGPPPIGLEDASKFANITRVLVARGYGDEDILGILGGNFVRVFKAVNGG